MFPIKDNIRTERFPLVTIALLAANIVAFFWSISSGEGGSIFGGPSTDFVVKYGFIPYELSHAGTQCVAQSQDLIQCGSGVQDQPSIVVTALLSMFLHGGLLHIAGNMLFLWVFGNNVEDSMGRVRFLAFYVLGGIAALAGQYAVGSGEAVPLVGASGAVAGVLGGYLLLYPRARVLTVVFIIFLFTLIEIPAMFFLGFWILQQIAFGALDLTNPVGGGGGVAYFAHIGGFVFGVIAIKLFARRRAAAASSRLGLP